MQVDSDLIFDSIEETNNVNSRQKRDLLTTNSIGAEEKSKSSHDEEDHWFSGALHRIRRHIGNMFHSGESAAAAKQNQNKRNRRQDDNDNVFEPEPDDYEDEPHNVSFFFFTSPPPTTINFYLNKFSTGRYGLPRFFF